MSSTSAPLPVAVTLSAANVASTVHNESQWAVNEARPQALDRGLIAQLSPWQAQGQPAQSYSQCRNHRRGRCASWVAWLLPLAALLMCHTLVRADSRAEQAAQLVSCLSQGQQLQVTSWNTSVMEDALPNLVVHKAWWSSRWPRFNLTVITQLSVDRLDVLAAQCASYQGPISAVVYLPLVQLPIHTQKKPLSTANTLRITAEAERVALLQARTEVEYAGCQLDVMLVYEVFDDRLATMLYPVNALRNLARMQARTPLLAAIDVDMMISSTLSQWLELPDTLQSLQQTALSRMALVLPAFEPRLTGDAGRQVAARVANGHKSDLQELFKKRDLYQFKLKVFPRGHTPTNYTHWFAATDTYSVRYQRMYEPWFISHWDVMPWFDTDFKGYGMNKIVYVASLNYYGFTFQVHPNAWLVHRPHGDTAVRKIVTRQASDVNKLGVELPKHALYTMVTQLFTRAKAAMVSGTYTPRIDPRIPRCMAELPWLQQMRTLETTPLDPNLFATTSGLTLSASTPGQTGSTG